MALPQGFELENQAQQQSTLPPGFQLEMPTKKQTIVADMKARPWGSGAAQFAYNLGGDVTDLLATAHPRGGIGAAAAGTGVNFLTNAIPAFLGGGNISAAPQALLNPLAKWLMQTAIKPSMADRLSGAADKAGQSMLAEGINATRGGMDKSAKLVDKLHKQVEADIASSTAEVPLGPVGQKYLGQYEKAIGQTNPQTDLGTVSNVWRNFETAPLVSGQESLPVQLAHLIKRGTQQSLGSKSYGEVGSTEIEAQKALARYLREGVAEAVPSVAEPLKREASLMNVRDVAMNRALAEANKNPLGLAALRMDSPLSALTFMADKSALVKSLLARLAYEGSQPKTMLPSGVAVAEATNSLRNQ